MTTSISNQNKPFQWLAIITVIILMIPLGFMQVTTEVDWGIIDFLLMGFMLYAMGTALIIGYRIINKKYHLLSAIIIISMFVWLWAELAVGVFTTWGD